MKTLSLSLVLTLALITVGCAHNVRSPIPGAVNQFDSDTYLAISTAKGTIDQAKQELAAGSFSATVAPKVKEAVNYAVTAYNTADVTYQAYHGAALAGSATAAQQSEVQRTLTNLNTEVTKIASAKGGK